MGKCDHLIGINMSFKLALKHSFIQNLSSLLHFISKLASLLINPEDWQEGGGRGEV